MTLQEFILENTITSIQHVKGVVFNVLCGETPYGLDVDTTNIPTGTDLITTNEFIITETELIVNDIKLDLEKINMLK
jgi:hypothetical protein